MVGWKLKAAQRAMFVDKLPDAANLALGALVFGQFVSGQFSLGVAFAGAMVWCVFMGFSAILARKDQ